MGLVMNVNEYLLLEEINQVIDKRMTEYIESPQFAEKIPKLIPVYNWPG